MIDLPAVVSRLVGMVATLVARVVRQVRGPPEDTCTVMIEDTAGEPKPALIVGPNHTGVLANDRGIATVPKRWLNHRVAAWTADGRKQLMVTELMRNPDGIVRLILPKART